MDRTPADIQRLISRAAIDELAEAWPTVLTEGFRCPVCSRRDKWNGATASVVDDITWRCDGRYLVSPYWAVPTRKIACRGGTIWSLRRLLLEDREAIERFIEAREVAA